MDAQSVKTVEEPARTQGARRLLAGVKFLVPRLKKIWADCTYRGKEWADWRTTQGHWNLEVVERTPGVTPFQRVISDVI